MLTPVDRVARRFCLAMHAIVDNAQSINPSPELIRGLFLIRPKWRLCKKHSNSRHLC